MNMKGNTMKLPTGYTPLTHEEMELVEGGAKLTIRVRTSTIKYFGRVAGNYGKCLSIASTISDMVSYCLPIMGLVSQVGQLESLMMDDLQSWLYSGAKKDFYYTINIKALKKSRTITI